MINTRSLHITRMPSVLGDKHCVVLELESQEGGRLLSVGGWTHSFIWFQCQLFEWLEHFLLKLLHLRGKDNLGGCRRVDTIGFDGDDDVATIFEEMVRV